MDENARKLLDAACLLAAFNGAYYKALLEQGFDEDQALLLVGTVTTAMFTSSKEDYNAKDTDS